MANYPFEKSPACFRMMSPELFFEAEAADAASLVNGLRLDLPVDAELDAILSDAR